MKILVYSTKSYAKNYLDNANGGQHTIDFISDELSLTSVEKAKGYQGICCFVTDCLDRFVISKLAALNIRLIALRSAGYDYVDISTAHRHGITVVRVPKYSPEAVAEFAVGLILVLNRQIIKSYQQGLEYNFSLDGLMGFNLCEKTIGIIGTGYIGTAFAQIMRGFGCRLLAHDPIPNDKCRDLGVSYVTLDKLLSQSDIVSLHCLLNDETRHLINADTLLKMKKGAMLINTGRGALIDTLALINALESGQLGYAGLDVYENEHDLFFIDHRDKNVKKDNLFLRLQSLKNVLITPHQAFFTQEAVHNIAKITIENVTAFENGHPINSI